MTGIVSRIVVGVVGLPVVLGLVWLGGWWLFGLLAFAAVVAVHEFVTVARPLRPLGPAAYLGVALALSGARVGGLVWLVGGFLAAVAVAVLFQASAATRAARRCSARPGSVSGWGIYSCFAGCTPSRACSRSPFC